MKYFAGAVLLGAAAIGVFAGPAAAASRTFCNGALVANSFYRITVSTEAPARAEYHGQFRFEETVSTNQIMTATMLAITRVGNFRVIHPVARFDLGHDEQKDIVLLSLRADRSGAGLPNAQTVGGMIDFICTYRPAN